MQINAVRIDLVLRKSNWKRQVLGTWLSLVRAKPLLVWVWPSIRVVSLLIESFRCVFVLSDPSVCSLLYWLNCKFLHSFIGSYMICVNRYSTVAVQITKTLNCLTSSVIEQKLLPGKITCWSYTVRLEIGRLIYLALSFGDNSLTFLTMTINPYPTNVENRVSS